MSASESGSTLRFRVPVDDNICTVIVGAGSVAVSCTLYNCSVVAGSAVGRIALALGWYSLLLGNG